MAQGRIEVAYLASLYPAPSHAFLTREIRGLRSAGARIETVSVRPAPPRDLLTSEDRDEARDTFSLLPIGSFALLAVHMSEFLRSPRRYCSTLLRAMRLPGPGLRARLWTLFYFAEAIVLRRHCRRSGITRIHAVQFADGAGDVALLAAHGAPGHDFSISVHGPGELYEVARYGLREKIRSASFVAVPAEFTRSQLMALVDDEHAERIHVVRMGVEPESFPRLPGAGRRDADVRVLCVARLVRHKGHATLLRALAMLAAEGLPLRTVLAGEGPERRAIERLRAQLGLDELVELRGAVGQDEVKKLYEESDVFCLPTLAETVGVANMEAMATGRPVVSSRLMGVPELIEDEVSGLLVTPGREDELAAALRRLAENPELRERLGDAGRSVVCDRFDSRREAQRLRDLLASY